MTGDSAKAFESGRNGPVRETVLNVATVFGISAVALALAVAMTSLVDGRIGEMLVAVLGLAIGLAWVVRTR